MSYSSFVSLSGKNFFPSREWSGLGTRLFDNRGVRSAFALSQQSLSRLPPKLHAQSGDIITLVEEPHSSGLIAGVTVMMIHHRNGSGNILFGKIHASIAGRQPAAQPDDKGIE